MFGDIRSNRGKNVRNGHTYHPKKSDRQMRARDRQIVRDALTPKQQIATLDRRLGVGVGAVKERARLTALMNADKK